MATARGGAAFPRAVRLCTAAAYRRVFAKPRKSVDALFTVLACPSDSGARLGLAISKKHVKTAVARNRIKRLVRESFRSHRESLGAQDLVVIARSGVAVRSNADIFASLERHWRRLARAVQPEASASAEIDRRSTPTPDRDPS